MRWVQLSPFERVHFSKSRDTFKLGLSYLFLPITAYINPNRKGIIVYSRNPETS